jgi:hypothetical protein
VLIMPADQAARKTQVAAFIAASEVRNNNRHVDTDAHGGLQQIADLHFITLRETTRSFGSRTWLDNA